MLAPNHIRIPNAPTVEVSVPAKIKNLLRAFKRPRGVGVFRIERKAALTLNRTPPYITKKKSAMVTFSPASSQKNNESKMLGDHAARPIKFMRAKYFREEFPTLLMLVRELHFTKGL